MEGYILNINDWKIIQMRNDLKFIKRKAMGNNAANWSLVIDILLVFLAFALERIIHDEGAINVIWIVVVSFGIIIPIFLVVVEWIKIKRAEKISRRVLNTKELVSIFDDEICYMIMSAESFEKKLKTVSEINSRQMALIVEFYAIEIEYYLNKAVLLLLKMDNNLTGVLDKNDIANNHISKNRLINSISLIASIYEELFGFCNLNGKMLKNFSVVIEISDAESHYNSLKQFTEKRKNIIEVNPEDIFKK